MMETLSDLEKKIIVREELDNSETVDNDGDVVVVLTNQIHPSGKF